ncbi:Ala-tRNA(Pro) deacylase [Singulisphaera sp. GP187]|uniref:aminoacyl-tRNA deacylase n=1 Tax=Singulisphaera sp. GP187 TaxID=1882752 RepID=UPI00092C214A|nr:YbaK/EbsC family protein [Singulisphaera sp. GP187]SIO56766.1 Ala-tRNA(Pro) deacylase [Singulisphaera sp. GP187]
MNIQQFLSRGGRAFEVLEHSTTYTAQQVAQAVHVPGDEVAKTVVLEADGRYVMAVLPSTHHVDLEKARGVLQAATVALADEGAFARLFPDCERGALPPFGSQYGLATLVDESLTRDERIVFEGNTHHEAIRMSYRDYEELERPQVADLSSRGW